MRRSSLLLATLAVAALLAWAVQRRLAELDAAEAETGGARPPVPVEVAPLERGSLTLRRTFSGALEAGAEFVVGPKVAGRLQRLEVDVGDPVERGQVVAYLDDGEFVQDVHQAEADRAVAQASLAEAQSALEIAERDLKRAQTLRAEGVTSESQLDAARAAELAERARLEVTQANLARSQAALEAARIRLGYARVSADWSGGDDQRLVAERYVDEGGTVSANTALLSIVELDPIVAVVNVPERDYPHLAVGQLATLTTDAYPGDTFRGRIARIAPVFRRATRQARVELLVDNRDERLKPGMFMRAGLELRQVDDVVVAPFEALTERDGRTGVFLVDEDGTTVSWRPVEVGVREEERVEIRGDGLAGRVVTLGQALCEDGSSVTIPATADEPSPEDADAQEPASRTAFDPR